MYQRLTERIGSTGKITENYGGYEIVVIDNEKFPWFDVFKLLSENGFQIWINRKEDHIQIMSKPVVN